MSEKERYDPIGEHKKIEIAGQIEKLKSKYPIIRYFDCGQVPARLQAVSRHFCELALKIAGTPRNAETSAALRKLLEAKECVVRSALDNSMELFEDPPPRVLPLTLMDELGRRSGRTFENSLAGLYDAFSVAVIGYRNDTPDILETAETKAATGLARAARDCRAAVEARDSQAPKRDSR